MKKTSKTAVFFGSGPVAAQSLRLLSEYMPIEAVVTKPRAPGHRAGTRAEPGAHVTPHAIVERPKRILVVDDNADGREALGVLLQTWGFEVCSAGDSTPTR